jgi:hypothetical protein
MTSVCLSLNVLIANSWRQAKFLTWFGTRWQKRGGVLRSNTAMIIKAIKHNCETQTWNPVMKQSSTRIKHNHAPVVFVECAGDQTQEYWMGQGLVHVHGVNEVFGRASTTWLRYGWWMRKAWNLACGMCEWPNTGSCWMGKGLVQGVWTKFLTEPRQRDYGTDDGAESMKSRQITKREGLGHLDINYWGLESP